MFKQLFKVLHIILFSRALFQKAGLVKIPEHVKADMREILDTHSRKRDNLKSGNVTAVTNSVAILTSGRAWGS